MKNKKYLIYLLILIAWIVVLRPPVAGGSVTSWYGLRFAFDRSFHPGTDIALPTGSRVNSTSWGTVKETAYNERHGYYIVFGHLPGVESRYLHLNTISVNRGQKVSPDIMIGTVGNTGLSTGSHLHFEIRVLNIPLPPYVLIIPGRIAQRIGAYRFIDSIIAGE
jgi:murein DD-endopeptidase MepM/ murein hydrolase activator NlpD